MLSKLLQLIGVPEWAAWLGLFVAATVALSVAIDAYGEHRFAAGQSATQALWDAERVARDRAVITTQARVAATEQQQAAKAAEVDHHVETQLAAVAADRDRAVRAAAGLRDQLAAVRARAVPSAPADPGEIAQTRALADSLSECSERYRTLAGERDELAVQLGGLIDLLPPEP